MKRSKNTLERFGSDRKSKRYHRKIWGWTNDPKVNLERVWGDKEPNVNLERVWGGQKPKVNLERVWGGQKAKS